MFLVHLFWRVSLKHDHCDLSLIGPFRITGEWHCFPPATPLPAGYSGLRWQVQLLGQRCAHKTEGEKMPHKRLQQNWRWENASQEAPTKLKVRKCLTRGSVHPSIQTSNHPSNHHRGYEKEQRVTKRNRFFFVTEFSLQNWTEVTNWGTKHVTKRIMNLPNHPFNHTSVHPSIYPSTHQSTYPTIYLVAICLSYISIYPSIYLTIHLSYYLAIRLSISQLSIHTVIHLSTHRCIHSSHYPTIHPSTY